MEVTVYFNCSYCGAENRAEVDTAEHLIDMESNCCECGHRFREAEADKIRLNAEADAIGRATDNATDRNE
jgi:transcription elongation factor Elf1